MKYSSGGAKLALLMNNSKRSQWGFLMCLIMWRSRVSAPGLTAEYIIVGNCITVGNGLSKEMILIVHKTEVKRSSPRQTFSTVMWKNEVSWKTRFSLVSKCEFGQERRKCYSNKVLWKQVYYKQKLVVMTLSIDFNTIFYIFFLTLHTQHSVRLSSIKSLGFCVFWKFIFDF